MLFALTYEDVSYASGDPVRDEVQQCCSREKGCPKLSKAHREHAGDVPDPNASIVIHFPAFKDGSLRFRIISHSCQDRRVANDSAANKIPLRSGLRTRYNYRSDISGQENHLAHHSMGQISRPNDQKIHRLSF